MKQFFILGRNPELSRAEIISFLKARNRKFSQVYFEENILILDLPNDEKINIQELGGTLFLGKIIFEGNNKDKQEFLNKNEIIPSEKFTYSIFGYNCEIIKDSFKKKNKKARFKTSGNKIKFQSNEISEIPNSEFYILNLEEKQVYLGIVTQKYDNNEVKKRDMQKPVRREALAISPRLSKILINLSEAKSGTLLLDPFCGIGSILQEALVKNIKVYGVDKDKAAINGAKRNIEWLKSEYNIKVNCTLENLDSKKIPDMQFGAIATETPLGKLIKKNPKDSEAKKIIYDFESLIIPILTRLKKVKKPEAKIAITFPRIRNFCVNYKKITLKTGLKPYTNPILEKREKQFINREILVLK